MARNLDQKALTEAIRQGQAKIAKGLKTGQMRSDGACMDAARKRKTDPDTQEPSPEVVSDFKAPNFVEDFKKKMVAGLSNNKNVVVGLVVAGQLIIFGLGFWLGAIFSRGSAPTTAQTSSDEVAVTQKADTQIPEPAKPVVNAPKDVTAAPKTTSASTEDPARLKPEKGTNTIVIQSIAADRKDELKPIQEFFNRKGIETEIIESGGLGLLVTKSLFMQDPNTEGTDGNKIKKQIQQLGLLYPSETGDTRFGGRPFQDAYGFKR
jgi:hypothetical protein